jgi:hypothetical protein
VGGGVACAATASVFTDGGSALILLSYRKLSQADIKKIFNFAENHLHVSVSRTVYAKHA